MIRKMTRNDEYYMHLAISLALRGSKNTLSNPMVGCVLVKNGCVVGKGYHHVFGEDHAEIMALKDAGTDARDSTAYVTLEPCSHYGKTPPCAPRLIEAGINRVVIGSLDPNPLVNGKGIDILKNGKVEVIHGILKDECDWLNRGFFSRIIEHRPWITLKAATGLDGKMCLSNGESKWITTPWSRRAAHLLRSENDAIMVGKKTVLTDDPRLDVRSSFGRSPLKVILDPRLEISPTAKVFENGKTLVYTLLREDKLSGCMTEYPAGTELSNASNDGQGLNLKEIIFDLSARGINYLLLEGGPTLISSFLKDRLVDEIVLFLSPRIMGQGIAMADKIIFQCMESTIPVRNVRISRIGKDLMLEGRVSCSQDW